MEITPTRSALLEMREERHLFTEGFKFLDEKRLLLVAEIMRQLAHHRRVEEGWRLLLEQSRGALAAAVERHGLLDLALAPAPTGEAVIGRQEREFFGVRLVEAASVRIDLPPVPPWPVPSPEVATCRTLFVKLAAASVELAAISGNLQRLMNEYRRTERRARALEDVILPELASGLAEITSRLEEIDQEESIRVRLGTFR